MKSMFPSKVFAGFHSPKSGKYSFANKKGSKYSVSLLMKSENIRIAVLLCARNLNQYGIVWVWIFPNAVMSASYIMWIWSDKVQ
jgi:hypothetical protein